MAVASVLVISLVAFNLCLKHQFMPVFEEYFGEVCSSKIGSTEQKPLEIRISLTYFEEFIALNIKNKSLVLCYPVQGLDC